MIGVVDFGMGNVGSILNMLKKLGHAAMAARSADDIARAEKLILPGVGAFDAGMRAMHEHGLIEVLQRKVLDQRAPILGICLGMQLLTRRSAEGSQPGLGWIDAETLRFDFPPKPSGPPLRVPHMGWNTVKPRQADGLFRDMPEGLRFYFVHSYFVKCQRPEDVLATGDYGGPFCAAVGVGHIRGVQFHPEKSHKFGMQLLRNFASGDPC